MNEWTCPSVSSISSNTFYAWTLVFGFTCGEAARGSHALLSRGMVISVAESESFPTTSAEAVAQLSPPATRNKTRAHAFFLLSQETCREKGQHGHCFQIYMIGTQIMPCIPRAETDLEFLSNSEHILTPYLSSVAEQLSLDIGA